ncbi:MAG: hypothetical protein K6C10_12410 [Prevotella sp.]|nr:hypothetical protein [Prevotella sp.]
MKKRLTIYLGSALLIVLTCCGNHRAQQTSSGTVAQEEITPEPPQPPSNSVLMSLKDSIYNLYASSLDETTSLQTQLQLADGLCNFLAHQYDSLFPKKQITREEKSVVMLDTMLQMSLDGQTTVDMANDIMQNVASNWLLSLVKTRQILNKWKDNPKEKSLFTSEAEAWNKFSNDFFVTGSSIMILRYFGGTIIQLVVPSLHQSIFETRVKDLDILLNDNLLNGNNEQGVSEKVAAETLVNSMKHYLDGFSDTSHLTEDEADHYLQILKEGREKLSDANKSLNSWLDTRSRFSDLLDGDHRKPYCSQTRSLLLDLAKTLDE